MVISLTCFVIQKSSCTRNVQRTKKLMVQTLDPARKLSDLRCRCGGNEQIVFSHSYRASWYHQSFVYSPTDSPVSCLKKKYIKIYIKQFRHLSQYLTNLMHKICFTISFISCLYMFRAHVLIIMRSKLYYTASGIITYRCDDTRGCVIQFWPPDDEHMCSKHVEAWNKTYCETNFVHQVG